MKKLYLIIFCLLISHLLYAQHPEWINYTNSDYVRSVVIDGDIVWVGTKVGGLVKLDKTTGEITVYNTSNS
ncbi:MAG: hypothetical protein K9J16_14330, partial [Melioribacteraceae bacterium]|nr:hypothetical protein [Melioribacteraceae bacterium]